MTLSVAGKKIAGMAQHWFRNRKGIRCVVTTASINIEEVPAVLANAVNAFYGGAGSATRCKADMLASVRLCVAGAISADFVPAFLQRLASVAESRGNMIRQTFPQLAVAHCCVIGD
jgi:hypothetical protein